MSEDEAENNDEELKSFICDDGDEEVNTADGCVSFYHKINMNVKSNNKTGDNERKNDEDKEEGYGDEDVDMEVYDTAEKDNIDEENDDEIGDEEDEEDSDEESGDEEDEEDAENEEVNAAGEHDESGDEEDEENDGDVEVDADDDKQRDIKFHLLRKKGTFPYDLMKDESAFKKTKLPDKKKFYNRLSESGVSDQEYEHAETVWNVFNCKTMRHYHDLYLLSDTMMLADVFENFRDINLDKFELEPLHYYSLPGLAWDCALKFTKVRIELIKDPDMHLMIKKGLRGGMSVICLRYAEANNPETPGYDPTKPLSYIIYLDANGLYAWAMTQPLPLRAFKWINPESFSLSELGAVIGKGHFLEVDIDYPPHLHERHNDYPMAPETIVVKDDMLSPLQVQNIPRGKSGQLLRGKVKKLVPNLMKKTNYIVHHRVLKKYIDEGLVVTKVHKVIEFEESDFFTKFIDETTQMRKKAQEKGDEAGVATYKLYNNAIFGKACENVEKRIVVELVQTNKMLTKRVAKPNFNGVKVFRNDLVAVNLLKTKVVLDRPTQVGFSILELSKNLMYSFHYDTWMKHFPKARLLFTDTDSLAYVVDKNPYKEMAKMKDEFDFSEYPPTHELFDRKNMKVLGKFKDETHSHSIAKFVGLRPKLYAIKTYETNKKSGKLEIVDKMKGKGITATARNKHLTFEKYEKCVKNRASVEVEMNTIRSINHQLYSLNVKKIGLSAADDKRWICEDGVNTLAHGHYDIKNMSS